MKRYIALLAFALLVGALAFAQSQLPQQQPATPQSDPAAQAPGSTPPTFPPDQSRRGDEDKGGVQTDRQDRDRQSVDTQQQSNPDWKSDQDRRDQQSNQDINRDRDRDRQSTLPQSDQDRQQDRDRDRDVNREDRNDQYSQDRDMHRMGGDLQGQLQRAFQDQGLSGVSANISGNSIELVGSVPTGKDKKTARSIAESYANGRKVVDRLTVSGRGEREREHEHYQY